MDSPLAKRLVSDSIWALVQPLLPPHGVRSQGGGVRPLDDRAVFTAIAYVVTTGCAWRNLPAVFGVSKATAHRRFAAWTHAAIWDNLDVTGLPDEERRWAEAVRAAAVERALSDQRHSRERSRPSETAV
jgi:transposase